MNGWGAITLGVLLLAVLVTLASTVHGRSVRSHHDTNSAHIIKKRNAWWSKKSTDEARRIPSDRKNEIAGPAGEQSDMAELLDCITEGCAPDHIVCVNQSQHMDRGTEFLECQLRLRMCYKRCFDEYRMK